MYIYIYMYTYKFYVRNKKTLAMSMYTCVRVIYA